LLERLDRITEKCAPLLAQRFAIWDAPPVADTGQGDRRAGSVPSGLLQPTKLSIVEECAPFGLLGLSVATCGSGQVFENY
jgi:hypothetical protein